MKPLTPHNPPDAQLDELIALALHGELTPEERAQFDTRLQNDPAAQAAYQEAQAMHDLLEKTHKEAQPDAAFEQRMVSGVRRKIQTKQKSETAWESALFFWQAARRWLTANWGFGQYSAAGSLGVVVLALCFAIRHDLGLMRSLDGKGVANPAAALTAADFYLSPKLYLGNAGAESRTNDLKKIIRDQGINYVETAQKGISLSGYVDNGYMQQLAGHDVTRAPKSVPLLVTGGLNVSGSSTLRGANTFNGGTSVNGGTLSVSEGATTINSSSPIVDSNGDMAYKEPVTATIPQGGTIRGTGFTPPVPINARHSSMVVTNGTLKAVNETWNEKLSSDSSNRDDDSKVQAVTIDKAAKSKSDDNAATAWDPNGKAPAKPAAAPAEVGDRKLIRNAQLELEVKGFQAAMDQITALTKSAGGYVDTSNSEKGGNGKLHGTVVVKVLPQNLDAFLLRLRDVGQVQNQSVSTDDVTKAYIDTQARLENSRRMETQLQDLLKHENSKVADLLAVERELGRVRGDIEQMQGQLKLYDFQVQYATVTMTMSEKDLNQAAAYLLKEQDEFSLFATDVEATFQKARQSADDFKAQVLTANLNHNSGSDVSAELVVMVAPDQIEAFLAQVRGLGRVANFTRQTQRVAKDGGDSTQPADETATEKDKVQVHLAIRSDDETRKQVALTVVAKAVDAALDQAKAAALANAGVEILSSSLNKTPQGQSTAQLSVRVPGKDYAALIAAFNALGRTASLSIQRNDNSGPGANGDDAPVIVSLSLTDDDAPLQETEMAVTTKEVDQQSQNIKKSAAAAGVEVKASSFERSPDGSETAQMTFRLPMAKYAAFVESVKALGKVESLTVRRDDRPDQTLTDDNAPAEIALQLHSQRDFVPDDTGIFATLGNTFGSGLGTLFGTLKFIGVIIAFLVPWVFAIVLAAWAGRRIYLWRKK